MDESVVSVKMETPPPVEPPQVEVSPPQVEVSNVDERPGSDGEIPVSVAFDESGDLYLRVGPEAERVNYKGRDR